MKCTILRVFPLRAGIVSRRVGAFNDGGADMQASILKYGATALIGTSLVGTFYLELLFPGVYRTDLKAPQGEFEWTLLSRPLPEARSILKVVPSNFGETFAAKMDLRPSGPSEAGKRASDFFVSAGFGPPPVAAPEAEAHARLETQKQQDNLNGWALGGSGPSEVFESFVAGVPPGNPSDQALNAPGRGPFGNGTPAGPFLDASVTSAPEPATLGLLAGGLVALSLAGMKRRRDPS